MQKVDANIVLRYVLNDHTELSPKAKAIIDQQVVEIPLLILSIAFWQLILLLKKMNYLPLTTSYKN